MKAKLEALLKKVLGSEEEEVLVKFTPREDITAYELALIASFSNKFNCPKSVIDNFLPENAKRHFLEMKGSVEIPGEVAPKEPSNPDMPVTAPVKAKRKPTVKKTVKKKK